MAQRRASKRKGTGLRGRENIAAKRRESVGWTLAAATVLALGAAWAVFWIIPPRRSSPADPENSARVARGAALYAVECSRCHGAGLEGQPNWQSQLADGSYPAPPHDASGHTWHHADSHLFRIVKAGGQIQSSRMPAFAGKLTDDDIWATLAFIKSRWPEAIRRRQPVSER